MIRKHGSYDNIYEDIYEIWSFSKTEIMLKCMTIKNFINP